MLQTQDVMESMHNYGDDDAKENILRTGMFSYNVSPAQDSEMANLDNPVNCNDNSDTPSSSSDANNVISNQIPSASSCPPPVENISVSPDENDETKDIVTDIVLSNRSTPLPNIPTNAFEIDRISSSEDLSKEISQKNSEEDSHESQKVFQMNCASPPTT